MEREVEIRHRPAHSVLERTARVLHVIEHGPVPFGRHHAPEEAAEQTLALGRASCEPLHAADNDRMLAAAAAVTERVRIASTITASGKATRSESQPEPADALLAPAQVMVQVHLSTELLHDLTAQRDAQTRAFRPGRPERLEQVRPIRRRDAGAGV